MMRKLRLKWILLAVPLAVGCWTMRLMTRPPSEIQVAVSFVGLVSNGTLQYTTRDGTFPVTSAIFCVSNQGSCKVVQYGLYAYEAKWNPGGKKASFNIGESGLFSVLSPRQSKTVSVPSPWSISGDWRPVFRFSNYGWRDEFQKLPSWGQDMLLHVLSERTAMHIHYESVTGSWVPHAPPVRDSIKVGMRGLGLTPVTD
jgi:hypothetical protein